MMVARAAKLYYIAPLRPNAAYILLWGARCRNEIPKLMPYLDSTGQVLPVYADDPSVNSRRGRRLVGGAWCDLHDYVPLYWTTMTPTQYRMRERAGGFENIAIFVFDAAQILATPGIITTDGNAASSDTTLYEGDGALGFLDWKIINTPKALSREYKRKKCAEVLVPAWIHPQQIEYVYTYNHNSSNWLNATVNALLHTSQWAQPVRPIITNPSLFN
jgi:hypothetical protein